MTTDNRPSVPTSTYISPHLPGMIRNLWKSDPSENSVRTALKLAGDLIQELIDLRAQGALVRDLDEAKLARMIDKALVRHAEMAGMTNQERWDARDDIARAVAEWLKEQGQRDRQVAERAWDRCVGEMPIDPDWKNFYADNNPYRIK